MKPVEALLANVPTTLRAPLFAAFQEIRRNFSEGRWEPSELNGGKLCEVAYWIVHGALTGTYVEQPSKPEKFANTVRSLEQMVQSNHPADRSLRILIPRVLIPLYEVRNNRGVGHIGGDVDPNSMDAALVVAMANWVLAELIRIFNACTIDEAQRAIDAIVERHLPLVWSVEGRKRVLHTSLSAADQALLLLYSEAQPTSASTLVDWIEYANQGRFRSKVLGSLHDLRYVEFDPASDLVTLSPVGVDKAEEIIGKISGAL